MYNNDNKARAVLKLHTYTNKAGEEKNILKGGFKDSKSKKYYQIVIGCDSDGAPNTYEAKEGEVILVYANIKAFKDNGQGRKRRNEVRF